MIDPNSFTFGGTAGYGGATITNNVITFQPADNMYPGLVSTIGSYPSSNLISFNGSDLIQAISHMKIQLQSLLETVDNQQKQITQLKGFIDELLNDRDELNIKKDVDQMNEHL
jgi:hypothetical protein